MQEFISVWFNVSLALIGAASLVMMFQSGSKLTKGLVRSLYSRIFMTTGFLLCNSVMHIFRIFFNWQSFLGEAAEYPEYIFIALAYISLLYTALKMIEIGKKFGFRK
jgi:hypothetical protein